MMRFIRKFEYTPASQNFDVRESSIHGMGVFSKRVFQKNEIITFYDGEYMDWNTAKIKKLQQQDDYIKSIAHSYLTIDGLKQPDINRGAGSFCNHSKYPNAKFWVRNNDCWIQATQNIKPNTEITVSYGKNYWKDRTNN